MIGNIIKLIENKHYTPLKNDMTYWEKDVVYQYVVLDYLESLCLLILLYIFPSSHNISLLTSSQRVCYYFMATSPHFSHSIRYTCDMQGFLDFYFYYPLTPTRSIM